MALEGSREQIRQGWDVAKARREREKAWFELGGLATTQSARSWQVLLSVQWLQFVFIVLRRQQEAIHRVPKTIL